MKAALRLWITVAESSATHPRRLPECAKELGDVAPLSVGKIEALLDAGPENTGDHPHLITVGEAADRSGFHPRTIRRWLDQENETPHSYHGHTKFYTYTQMSRVVGLMLKKYWDTDHGKGRPIQLHGD